MTTVIKRGGRRQSFMPSKIKKSITAALRDAKVSASKRNDVVKNIGQSVIDLAKKKRIVKAVDIRKSILGRLDRVSKAAVSAWRRSEKKKKK
ncbi:hypothetical protein A3K82_02995 [Candidatus Pacearchaeota archaeon RBG_19FT_COMBO_34_9]|nr:MAG: hypothetical protein A3K82_02995 [Candidatus Pacearchaeota archaeon RBG_19FT_COMBO_34_9]OGJ17022.1 MAG: hypothetical protein A3K74_01375 [Candidatus Pacearchaeota archaeon RBG_13_33_26]